MKLHVTRESLKVDTWFERDRSMVCVYAETSSGRVDIAEWWDEDVEGLVEDGFLDPSDWDGSAIDYVEHLDMVDCL